jgi:NhaP-type Na+/H+ or K+/H+ antiporter
VALRYSSASYNGWTLLTVGMVTAAVARSAPPETLSMAMAGALGASVAMTEAASVRELVEQQVDRFLSSRSILSMIYT